MVEMECSQFGTLLDVLVIPDLIGAPAAPRVIGHKLHTSTAPDGYGSMKIFRNRTALAGETGLGLPVEERFYRNLVIDSDGD